jgi:hypothetical protein
MLATGLMRLRAECDDNNLALHQDARPVIPLQLVTLRLAKFIQDMLMPFRDRLKKFWTLEKIEEIEADHRGLHKLYHDDENVRKAIDEHDVTTLFNAAWDCAGRSDRLHAFCGGLATVFPNTTAVESNFWILKWEMDEIIPTAAQFFCPKPQIPKFRMWARKCFPPHPIPKQSFPNFGIWV